MCKCQWVCLFVCICHLLLYSNKITIYMSRFPIAAFHSIVLYSLCNFYFLLILTSKLEASSECECDCVGGLLEWTNLTVLCISSTHLFSGESKRWQAYQLLFQTYRMLEMYKKKKVWNIFSSIKSSTVWPRYSIRFFKWSESPDDNQRRWFKATIWSRLKMLLETETNLESWILVSHF